MFGKRCAATKPSVIATSITTPSVSCSSAAWRRPRLQQRRAPLLPRATLPPMPRQRQQPPQRASRRRSSLQWQPHRQHPRWQLRR